MDIEQKKKLAKSMIQIINKKNTSVRKTSQNSHIALEAINLLMNVITPKPKLYQQLIQNLNGKPEDVSQALDRFLVNTKSPLIDYSTPNLTLPNLQSNLAKFAIDIEQALLQAQKTLSLDERYANHSQLQVLAEQGKVIPEKSWLSGADLKEAFSQLARNHYDTPELSDKFKAVQIVTLGNAKTINNTDLINALNTIKDDAYPAHMIIHANEHWLQLDITKMSDGSVSATLTDTLEQTNKRLANLQELINTPITGAFKTVYGANKVNDIMPMHTGAQTDNWSCGFQVLADITKKITIDTKTCPANDSIESLRDWSYGLIIGQTSNEYHDALKQNAVLCHPPSLYTKPMPWETIGWIKNNICNDIKSAGNKQITFAPKDASGKPSKASILVNSKQVGVNHAASLDTPSKESIADNMAQTYIAQKLGLTTHSVDFPSPDIVKENNLCCLPIRGNDTELKALVTKALKQYGVKIIATIDNPSSTADITKKSASSVPSLRK